MAQSGGLSSVKVGGGVQLTLLVGAAALAFIVADHLTTPFDPWFDEAADAHGVPANLLRAIARVESSFNVNARNPLTGSYPNSGTWDVGLMQINTRTGAGLGLTPDQLRDTRTNILAAARVLAQNRHTLGDKFSAYTWPASYNVGPGNVGSATGQAYAAKVLYHWQLYDVGRILA